MLRLELDPPKQPVYLYPSDSLAKTAAVSATIRILCDEGTKIGGIVALWQVNFRRPLGGTSFQTIYEWDKPQVVDTIVTDIVGEECWLGRGEVSYDFVIQLPSTLLPSRLTDFEKINHTLSVVVLAPTPPYSEDASASVIAKRDKIGPWTVSSWLSGRTKSRSSSPEPGTNSSRTKAVVPAEHPFGFSLVTTQEDIRVVSTQKPKGQPSDYIYSQQKVIPGVAEMKIAAWSNFLSLGSHIFMCIRLEELNPLATVHSALIALEQSCTCSDQTESHVDRYTLHSWDTPVHDSSRRYLWRGKSARQAGQFKSQGIHEDTSDDTIHMNTAVRLPSPANGAITSTNVDPGSSGISTTRHDLVVEILVSVYGMDVNDQLIGDNEGTLRRVSMRIPIQLGDCSFARESVVMPRYDPKPSEPIPDPSGLLQPLGPGETTCSLALIRQRTVHQLGKQPSNPKKMVCSLENIRRHQRETSGSCLCFFQEAFDRPANHSGQNLTDILNETPEDSQLPIEERREIRIRRWRERHPQARKDIPGFLHVLMKPGCECQTVAQNDHDVGEGKLEQPQQSGSGSRDPDHGV